MSKYLLLFLLIIPINSHALPDNIGFRFFEIFSGYLCADETDPSLCDKRVATEKLSIEMLLSHESANRYFLKNDLLMVLSGKIRLNNHAIEMQPGFFLIEDLVDENKLMYFHYGFSYIGRDGVQYAIELKKRLFMDYPEETMWEDLTTMYVKRWQIFGSVKLPAGTGIITMPKDPFTIEKWIGDLKSSNGTARDDLDIKMMALDFFIFDRFDRIYDGHPLN